MLPYQTALSSTGWYKSDSCYCSGKYEEIYRNDQRDDATVNVFPNDDLYEMWFRYQKVYTGVLQDLIDRIAAGKI